MALRTKVGLVLLSFTLISILASTASAQLINLSTRGAVGTGDNVMIAGFIIGGTTPVPVLIRGRGPSMSGAPFFVPGTIANPLLQIFSGSSFIAENDNWQQSQQAEIIASGLSPCEPNPGQGSAPPGCAQESAIIVTLQPGAYTAILRGVGGGSFSLPPDTASTGVGLVEVFELTGGVTAPLNMIGIYTGSISVTQAGCQNSFNNGSFGAFATLNINSQTGSLFSGTGNFSAVGDSVTINFFGTVTGTGTLAGTFSTIGVPSGNRTAGTFDGSLVGNAITIDLSGQATSGETCTVDGLLSASR